MPLTGEETVALRLTDTQTTSYRGRRTSRLREVTLPTYEVLLDGERIGDVQRAMVTREVGPASRPYVSDRWSSPGWLARFRGSGGGHQHETRLRAVTDVLAGHFGVPFHEVEALAKAAEVQR